MHGIGATPLYTLGVSYLDDNLLPSTTSLFVGELKAETAVGHRYKHCFSMLGSLVDNRTAS